MFEVNGKRPGKMGAQTTTKTGMVTKELSYNAAIVLTEKDIGVERTLEIHVFHS